MRDFENKSRGKQGPPTSLTPGQQETAKAARPATAPPAALPRTAAQRFAQAVWGPLVGLLVNLILVVIKVLAGLASGSVALVADAGHSGADVANNVLVELSIQVDPQMAVARASQLAEQVRDSVCAAVPSVGDVTVELNTNHVARLRKKLR